MQVHQASVNSQYFPRSASQNLGRRGNTKKRRPAKRKRIEREGREEKQYLLHTPPCINHFYQYGVLRAICRICFRIPMLQVRKLGSRELCNLPKVTQLTPAEVGVRFKTPSSLQLGAPSPATPPPSITKL